MITLICRLGGMVNFTLPFTTNRDDFSFHITNFHSLSRNIPSWPAYGVFISQCIRYTRACSSYECFILRVSGLSSKLLKEWSIPHGTLEIVIHEVLCSMLESKSPSHESQMKFWPSTNYSGFSTDQTFHQFHELYTEHSQIIFVIFCFLAELSNETCDSESHDNVIWRKTAGRHFDKQRCPAETGGMSASIWSRKKSLKYAILLLWN